MIAAQSISHTRMVSHRKAIRLFILVTLLFAVFSCGALVHAYAGGHEDNGTIVVEPAKAKPVKNVEVERGDTLWSIAGKYAPKSVSRHEYVDKLMEANGLKSTDLRVGQLLVLP